jgi:putative redox protein
MMEIGFPGGAAVEARYRGFTIATDQPEPIGGNRAPSPFDLFLASLGTCAGFYALRFCQERHIDTAGMRLTLEAARDPESKRLASVVIEITLPPGFPKKYREALVRAAHQCAVQRVLEAPPEFQVRTRETEPAAAERPAECAIV